MPQQPDNEDAQAILAMVNCWHCNHTLPKLAYMHPSCPTCEWLDAVVAGKCWHCGTPQPHLTGIVIYCCPNCGRTFHHNLNPPLLNL